MIKRLKHATVLPLYLLLLSIPIVTIGADTQDFSNNRIGGGETIPDDKIVAVWSQLVGHQTTDATQLKAFSPPDIELRFVISGIDANDSKQICNNNLYIFHTHAKNGHWEHDTADDGSIDLRSQSMSSYTLTSGNFDVRLCTLKMKSDWYQVALSTTPTTFTPINVWKPQADTNQSVQLGAFGPASIGAKNTVNSVSTLQMITLGDTGCRGHDGTSSRRKQKCGTFTDPEEWAFPPLMATAAASAKSGSLNPDLVMHVGDYRYYLEHSISGPNDTFKTWYYEFINPAQPLLRAAPWVFSRGNHEECPRFNNSWFGNAWRYLFAENVAAINNQSSCSDLLPTRYFDIGANSGTDTATFNRIVMIDDSDADSSDLTDRFSDAIAMSQGDNGAYMANTHWIGHVPGLTFLGYCNGQCFDQHHVSNGEVQQDLQTALKNAGKSLCKNNADGTFSCTPSVIFRGHQHFFESITSVSYAPTDQTGPNGKSWIWPQVYIVGHGGTKHDSVGIRSGRCKTAARLSGDATASADATAWIYSTDRHGYVAWSRNNTIATDAAYPTGWKETLVWDDGQPSPSASGTGGCGF